MSLISAVVKGGDGSRGIGAEFTDDYRCALLSSDDLFHLFAKRAPLHAEHFETSDVVVGERSCASHVPRSCSESREDRSRLQLRSRTARSRADDGIARNSELREMLLCVGRHITRRVK